MFCRKLRNLLGVIQENGASHDNECLQPLLDSRLKRALQIRILTSNYQEMKLLLQSTSRVLIFFTLCRVVPMPKDSNARNPRNHVLEQFQPFPA